MRALKILFINYPKDELRLLRPLISSRVIEPIMIYTDIKLLSPQSIFDLSGFDIIYLANSLRNCFDKVREAGLNIPKHHVHTHST
jgi:hypothetical protein